MKKENAKAFINAVEKVLRKADYEKTECQFVTDMIRYEKEINKNEKHVVYIPLHQHTLYTVFTQIQNVDLAVKTKKLNAFAKFPEDAIAVLSQTLQDVAKEHECA